MSRALPKYNKRRVLMIGGTAAVVLSGAVIAGNALAGETSKSGTNATTKAATSPGTVNCPAVAPSLPAIPASAQAEVTRNLTLLDTQIAEANKRLVDTVGQGGPNFVQNAILGPLKDKRVATINRIATAIGRTAAKPTGLDSLAPCTLNANGVNAGGAAATAAPSATATQQAGNTGNTGNTGATGNTGSTTAAGTITCPDVASKLPAIPATAQAEVTRNLTLLNTQITEANTRLANTVGQGGPNFVQNAILGPLADKRKSTIDRIAISIGRTAAKPTGLDSLATCTLNK
ncbi:MULTISPECIES: hypothetical protein [Streptomyces]|jgi:hypothetical protein|uniref:Collagen triple helix repeat-containing protein n=2 Tax=Streptomyces mirabilis TaxID=68239 RepID=A0ABU3UXX3_9ACTN|nr:MULTISPECIES: hypothetical protein [Streptomyces]MCX4425492.1 hypothetical protein [Streptomyces mirabilis]MCX4607457.1 hypothetical protein [Streptomyces mirabilis]MCX5347920.1 hypothetical protein [Streptomyces mirabilis]MCZ1005019.1 hypothetical protein [Streptomyces mirabilis]MDU8998776.1 hypothetical protein [Streptomyces mirabilis]